MKKLFIIVLTLLTCSILFAKDNIERVSLTYEYRSDNPNESPEQAEYKALERAKQKALEDKFGVDVSSINSTFLSSKSNGENAVSTTNVFSIGSTAVKGVWIETIEEKILVKQFDKGFWYVKVYVEGKARHLTETPIEIKAALVNNIHDKDSRELFYDGDDIFLRFLSPVSGNLCVYLIDEEQNAFCLLPYDNNSAGCQKISANEDYLFFSRKTDNEATEYTLNTQRTQESNAVYIIFSPNTFIKATDQKGTENWRNEPLPRSLSYAAFLKWLAKNQTHDPKMVVKTELITIKR